MLNNEVTISNISNFLMLANNTYGGTYVISCQHQASLFFENVIKLRMKGLRFIGCGSNTFSSIQNFMIENSTFQGQSGSGTALDITDTNLTIVNSSFISNRVGRCLDIFDLSTMSNISVRVGGAIFVDMSNVSIINCIFVNNSAEIGGAMYSTSNIYEVHNNITISNSTFISNQAASKGTDIQDCYSVWANNNNTKSVGGVIAIFQSKLIITLCTFTNNTSAGESGVLSIEQNSTVALSRSKFHGSSANSYGGVFFMRESSITINCSVFLNSSAKQGGVMHSNQHSVIVLNESTFRNNSAKLSGGVLSLDERSQVDDYHSQFIYNRATTGGVVYAIRSGITLEDSDFSFNQATEMGGAIYILQSQTNIMFYGKCQLTHNSAGTGGAISAIESTVILTLNGFSAYYSQLSIEFNMANHIGGGLYLYRSVFNSILHSVAKISHNSANSSGGGIHATDSIITCIENYYQMDKWPHQTLIIFANNSATKGGGLFLEAATQLRIQKVHDITTHLKSGKLNFSISFTSNSAKYGSAVYVADETYYFNVCGGRYGINNSTVTATSYAECFIQVFSHTRNLAEKSSIVSIEFTTDNSSENIIFGGLLDRCLPDCRRAEIFTNGNVHNSKEIDGFTYLRFISNINDTTQISSLPVRVCFCGSDHQPDCSYEPLTVQVKKGERFNVSLVAVDQVNHTLENVTIYAYFNNTWSSLGEDQSIQTTHDACTNLTFSIYSLYNYTQLILYAEGPCRNAKLSQSLISVYFEPCICPRGFQNESNPKESGCVCICDKRLSPYFTEADNNCNSQTGSLVRRGNFWIGLINDTNITSENSNPFLIYPYCPLGYCLPPTSDVFINLNLVNGADAQCANNRSGLLCALCQPGLSLSLGSSQCISYSKAKLWYVPLLLVAIVAGILLVALLMMLNLTVAIGTLNGMIFYANIFSANSSMYFSGLSSIKYYSVLISWFNLDVGFDVCFFEGMNTYWKTWLQLAFPMYIIFLVAVVIIVSEKSMTFSRLIGKANPVATLATLILLSYTKFLQTTITTLSLVHLNYPNGSHEMVWLPDATIKYLSRKHIPLFIVAVLILVIGIAYTSIIFSWQWLLHYQDKTIFKWVRSQQLCHFIEPYHAPYVSKHRYWTGLLLFTRIVLYLVFALNVSGDPGVNLLAVIISVVGLLMIKGKIGQVYKSAFVDLIEMACYTNLGVLSTIKLKFEDMKIINFTTHISGAFTMMLLVAIVSYHMYARLKSNCFMRYTNMTERELNVSANTNDTAVRGSLSNKNKNNGKPTFSALYLGQPNCCRQNSAKVETNENIDQDDRSSSASTDSISPLLDDCN